MGQDVNHAEQPGDHGQVHLPTLLLDKAEVRDIQLIKPESE